MANFFRIVVNNAAPAGLDGATGTFLVTCSGPAPGSWSAPLGSSAPISDPVLQQAEFGIPVGYLDEGDAGWPDGEYRLAALSIVPNSGMPADAVIVQPPIGFTFYLPDTGASLSPSAT